MTVLAGGWCVSENSADMAGGAAHLTVFAIQREDGCIVIETGETVQTIVAIQAVGAKFQAVAGVKIGVLFGVTGLAGGRIGFKIIAWVAARTFHRDSMVIDGMTKKAETSHCVVKLIKSGGQGVEVSAPVVGMAAGAVI